jgi:hypothetical protein
MKPTDIKGCRALCFSPCALRRNARIALVER